MGGLVGSPSNSAGAAAAQQAAQARADEEARQARIKTGLTNIDQQFSAFNPEYYQKQSDAYTSYYLPQLDKQYAEAKKKLTYNLARTSNLNSSEGAQQFGKLAEAYSQQQGQIGNQAATAGAQMRSQVESDRGDLINQLNSTADPNIATSAAQNRAQALLSQPAQLSPLANAFEALTASFSNAANQGAYNGNSPFFGTTIGNLGDLNKANKGSYSSVQ